MSQAASSDSALTLISASPRRRDLLTLAGFEVTLRPSHVDETLPAGLALGEAAIALATRKLRAMGTGSELRLAADTLVAIDEHVLGKPADTAAAHKMLGLLSGRVHRVITGFAVSRGEQVICEAVITEVGFRALSAREIEGYVARGESFDKAGAYGIQGDGAALTSQVTGSLTNVIGLPIAEVLRAIEALGTAPHLG